MQIGFDARQAEQPLLQYWAQQLKLPFQHPEQAHYLLQIHPEAQHLQLQEQGEQAAGPVFVDFCEGAARHRRLYGGGRKQPIARALGIKPKHLPTVIDATAGLGRDSFVMATLGCEVLMLERSPIAAALLADGLKRGAENAEVADIIARMRLHPGNSIEYLSQTEVHHSADTIYLDPMYPHRQKSALVKKEMRLFRDLVGDDPDTEQLLQAALGCARQRVVVKRPKTAPCLAGPKPSLDISSKNTRFDVYLIPQPA